MTDDLIDPQSIRRERFWKFYGELELVKKGLIYGDYDYVWTIIQRFVFAEDDNVLLTRALYQIFCKEIISSAKHISEILKRAGNHVICQYLRL